MKKSILSAAILAASSLFGVNFDTEFFREAKTTTEAAMLSLEKPLNITVKPKAEFVDYGKYGDYAIIRTKISGAAPHVLLDQFYLYDEKGGYLISDLVDTKNGRTPINDLKNMAKYEGVIKYLSLNKDIDRSVIAGESLLQKEGAKSKIIWVDPACPHCVEELQALGSYDELMLGNTAVRLILYPILGENSVRKVNAITKKLAVTTGEKERYNLVRESILNGIKNEDVTDTAFIQTFARDQIQWNIFGIKYVPFILETNVGDIQAPNGREIIINK